MRSENSRRPRVAAHCCVVLLACAIAACNGSGTGDDGMGGADGQGGAAGQGGSGPEAGALPLPTRITVDTSENRPGIDRTITITYDLAPDGLPDAADLHIERDDGTTDDMMLTFVRDGAVEPCAAPPSVLAQEQVDALFFYGIGGCPAAVNAGGLVTEYTYGPDGHVTSATTDWGAYGTGVLDAVSAGGVVASVHHEYAFGVTSLAYQPGNDIDVSGSWDADGSPASSPLTGRVELDAEGRRERVTQTTSDGVEVLIVYEYE